MDARLNEFDRDEWWDVCRIARPGLARDEFDRMWAEFCEWKAKRRLN